MACHHLAIIAACVICLLFHYGFICFLLIALYCVCDLKGLVWLPLLILIQWSFYWLPLSVSVGWTLILTWRMLLRLPNAWTMLTKLLSNVLRPCYRQQSAYGFFLLLPLEIGGRNSSRQAYFHCWELTKLCQLGCCGRSLNPCRLVFVIWLATIWL